MAERVRDFIEAPTPGKLKAAEFVAERAHYDAYPYPEDVGESTPEQRQRNELDFIERTAGMEYRLAADQKLVAAAGALVFYLVGLLLLLAILGRQAYFIARNAGWIT